MSIDALKKLRLERNRLIADHNWKGALRVVDEMIAIHPTPSSHTRRAMLLIKLGRNRDAIMNLKEALTLDPEYHKAREILQKLSFSLDVTLKGDNLNLQNIREDSTHTDVILLELTD